MEVEWDTEGLAAVVNEGAMEDRSFMIKCCDLANGIKIQSADLLKLVEKLGPMLTDKNPELRVKGTQTVAEVLQNLPQDCLQESELCFVTAFFCDRLKDHNTVIPAVLQGILAIVQMNNLPEDAPAQIATVMFQHVHCQSHRQPDRNTVYKILDVFIKNFSKELKLLGPDFVFGVISMIDGERDPRNLLLLFGMLPRFIKTFPLGHLTEEMFEVMACYFPIDFYSVPNSPDAVARDDLAAALLQCLTATPAFAEFCITLLLEKLDSQLRIAKLDSLRLLQECCKAFTVEGLEKNMCDLLQSLHREVIPGTDKEVCKEGLAALKELVNMLSIVPVSKDQGKLLHKILENIISTACQELRDVQLSLFLPTARMLLTVTQASPAACHQVIIVVAPLLLSQYHQGSTSEGKVILLQTLTAFLAVCEEKHVTPTSTSGLDAMWSVIYSIYMDAAQHVKAEIRLEGVHGFLILASSLSCEARSKVYELLCTYVKQEHSSQVRQEVTACLKGLARLYPDELMEEVVLTKLQLYQESGNASDALILARCMDALCEIAVEEPFTACIVPQILSFITKKFQGDECSAGIRSLRKLVEEPECGSNLHRYLCVQCGVISHLVSWWLHGIWENKHPEIFQNENLIADSAKIISTILRNQTESVQFDILAEFIPWFLDPGQSPEESNVKPLEVSSSWPVTQSVVLLEALLSPVRQDVNIPSLSFLVTELQTLAIHSSHSLTSRSAARLVASIVNKAHDDEHLSTLLSDLSVTLLDTLNQNDIPVMKANNAISLFSWLTKALVMRHHRQADIWVDKLIGMLSHGILGTCVAEGFKLIMDQNDEYINSDNYCNIRVLYRQRFFQTVPKLVELYHHAADPVRCNFLIALAYMLQGVPRAVLTMSLQELIPLLVVSLGQRQVVLLLSTLEILHDLLESKQPVLAEHIQTFLPKFLQLTRYEDSMKVRIVALQCLLKMCVYPTQLLLPYKQQTVLELGSCLDDPKRLVRQQAVATRSRWYVVGAPGEPART